MQGRVAANNITDHCLEGLREAVMCNADFFVGTFEWRSNWRRPRPNYIVDHICVDWDSLESWAMERTFSVFDQKSLIHSELSGFRPARTMFPDRLVNGESEI